MKRKKNLAVLAVLVLMILAAAAASLLLPRKPPVVQRDAQELDLTFVPAGSAPLHVHRRAAPWGVFSAARAGEAPGDPAEPTPAPLPLSEVRAWLLISVGSVTYTPIPLTQEGELILRQQALGRENHIHVTPDSVTMAYSTCENQLCVGEGTVTLDNKETRVLGGYIICLPNEVTLELYSTEEITALLGDMTQEGAAQEDARP